jgi:hypothetical protein
MAGHLAGALGSSSSTPSDTVARVSWKQLAGLYLGEALLLCFPLCSPMPRKVLLRVFSFHFLDAAAGTIEFGYFLRFVEDMMNDAGKTPGDRDCTALLDFAEALPPEVIRCSRGPPSPTPGSFLLSNPSPSQLPSEMIV